MRFQALNIPAFGPFTGKYLDLSTGAGRLEIIYGANEAGKSSLLRAISTLLFGFGRSTTDDFLHPYGELRVGATIEHEGRMLSCLRRKGNKNTLRDEADSELVTEDDLLAVAPIASQQVFEVMFGLDAERLKRGGDELLAGHGEFGQLLFSAAAGIEGLHSILSGLDGEASDLFKPRSTTAKIPRLLADYNGQRIRMRDAQVTPRELDELRERKEQVLRKLGEVRGSLSRLSVEKERLSRIRSSVGLLDERRLVLSQLEPLASVAPLRERFAAEYAAIRQALTMNEAGRQGLLQRVARLQAELAGIEYSKPLLAHEASIEALYQRLGAEQKAQADLPKLRGNASAMEAELLALLANLGEPPSLDDLARLQVPPAEAKLAASLATAQAALSANLRNASTQAGELAVDVDLDAARLAALAPLRPVGGLEQALRIETQPEAKRRDQAAKVTALEGRIAEEARLLPWPGSVDELLRAALPAEATVTEWRRRLEAAALDRREAEKAHEEADRELARHGTNLRRLQGRRVIATLNDLTMSRDRRQQGWQAVRQSWLEGSSQAAREFLPEADVDPALLAQAYEGTVAKADAVADELRVNADDVALMAQAEQEVGFAREKVAACSEELARKDAVTLALQEEWSGLWLPWGVPASEPSQMAEWLRRRALLADRVRELDVLRSELAQAAVEEEVATSELRQAIGLVLGVTPEPGSTLAALRSQATALLEEQKKLATARQNLEEQLAAARRRLAVVQRKESAAREDLAAWHERWNQLVERLKLHQDAEPAAVQELLQLRSQVTARHNEYVITRTRIDGILRDSAKFESDARLVVVELAAPDTLGMGAMDAVRHMYQQLAAHRKARDLAVSKHGDLAAETAKLDDLDNELVQSQAVLKSMVEEAGCAADAEIPTRMAEWSAKQAAQARLGQIQQSLAAIAAGRTLEALEEEARGVETDEIPGRLESVEQARGGLEQERDELIREDSALSQKLAGFEGRTDARDAAADLQGTRAALLEESENYVRLRLAEQVLRSAIDEFRRKSTGKLLERSSQIFAALTLNSFEGLKLEYGSDARGSVILVGVRPDRRTVTVDGMSEGTRDQLYLALRIASLEVYFEKHPAIPLIADDILVNFDDARAAAALGALADLARHTQVLLFTHHRHMVELAGQRLGPAEFVTYRLERLQAAG
ncbi:AAA family ATPase [Paludibaculum fermentans]|uniref:ATP-binding protein n=1 Tax=Paludibaculum fermentans TaxID=1473598 RepID=UPI003EBC3B1F